MKDIYIKLLEYLIDLGVDEISDEDEKILLERVKSSNNPNQLFLEYEVLSALNKVLLSTYKKVTIENMRSISKTLDDKTLMSLFMQYHTIKSSAKDKFTCLDKFKEVVAKVLLNQRKENKELENMAKKVMDQIDSLEESLYSVMTSKSRADKLIRNCVKRSTDFASKCNGDNLRKLVDYLKNNFDFNEAELLNISSRCATFFAKSSAAKIDNLYIKLNEYKEFVRSRLNPLKDKEALELLNRSFKDILSESSLVATYEEDKINETLRFLLGEKIGNIIPGTGEFYGIKGDFTPSQLAKIYSNSITSLGMGVKPVLDFSENISKVYSKLFNKELNMDGFINGKNFTGIGYLTKKDYVDEGKAEQILRLLSDYMTPENIENVLRNHVAFLKCEVDEVKRGLRQALIEATNPDEVKKNILSQIRCSFGVNKREDNDFERRKYSLGGNLNKIEIINLNESKIEEMLEYYGAKSDELELWRNNYNKASKKERFDYIEKKFNQIIEGLEGIEELVPTGYEDLDKYLLELNAIDDLVEELKEEYYKVSDSRLNKKLNELSIKVYSRIEEVKSFLKEKYTIPLSVYKNILINTNLELEKKEEVKNKYYKDVSELEENEMVVKECEFVDKDIQDDKEFFKGFEKQTNKLKRKIMQHRKNKKNLLDEIDMLEEFVTQVREFRNFIGINEEEAFQSDKKKAKKMMNALVSEGLLKEVYDVDWEVEPIYIEDLIKELDPLEKSGFQKLVEKLRSHQENRISLIEAIKGGLKVYNYNTNKIDNVDEGEKVLDGLIKDYNQELWAIEKLFSDISGLKAKLSKVDIKEIEESIVSLNEKIRDYATRIEKIEKRLNK